MTTSSSTIKSKEDATYIVPADALIPLINNDGSIKKSVNPSQLVAAGASDIVADKAAAQALTPAAGITLYILSADGRGNLWRGVAGAAPGTYADDSALYCGTQFLPTGDATGSSAWVRDYKGEKDARWFGAVDDNATDNTTSINEWLATGGLLGLYDGIYLTDGNHSLITGTSITGDGTLKRRVDNENPILNLDNISGIRISDIGINGNKSIVSLATAKESRKGEISANVLADGNLTTDVRIDNVRIEDAYNWGMRFFGLQDAKITNCTIKDGDTRGIGGGSNWDDVEISGNTIDTVYQSGISINGMGTMSAPSGTSQRVTVTNNRVSGVLNDPLIVFSGIGIEMIGECTTSIISLNTVTDCASMSISTGFTSGLTVTNNTCKTVAYSAGTQQGWGIELTGVSTSTYANNNISEVREAYSLQSCEHVTIDGGVIVDTVRTSITGTDADTKVVVMKGNQTSTGLFGYEKATNNVKMTNLVTKGFHFCALMGDRCEQCEFTDWVLDSPYRGFDIGFGGLIDNPDDILVSRNTIRNIWERGIRLANTTNSEASKNRIIGERNAGATGIVNSGSTTYRIVDNTVQSITNSDSGIIQSVFVDGDTTPDVSLNVPFLTVNTGATSITTFDNGLTNQILVLTFGDANTTLVDGATLQLHGGDNFVSTTVDTMILIYEGTKWIEVSRSVN